MKITLVRGNERAEIEGDDDLITKSICYQLAFERRVDLIAKLFYAGDESEKQEAP